MMMEFSLNFNATRAQSTRIFAIKKLYISLNDYELHKNPPTPFLWKAPASIQKTKRKTRPAIRRSARWRASVQKREQHHLGPMSASQPQTLHQKRATRPEREFLVLLIPRRKEKRAR
jgi:hypothetical protein